jgi:hypothetical protein
MLSGLRAKFAPVRAPSNKNLKSLLGETDAKLKDVAPAVLERHGAPQ